MGKFEWLKQFDRDPAYVTVNYRGRKTHQSRTGGLISLIFLISVISILFFKIYSMLQQDKVIFETLIGKDKFDRISVSNMNLSISILDSNNMSISYKRLQKYGLKVMILVRKFDKNGKIIVQKNEQLTPRQNSSAEFDVKDKNWLSVKGRLDVISSKQMADELDEVYYEQFSIRIKSVNSSKYDNVDMNESVQIEAISPLIKFTNHVINQQIKDISQAIFDDQLRIFKTGQPLIIGQSTVQYTFEIKKVVMITDLSVFPTFIKDYLTLSSESRVQSWFYGEEFSTQTYFGGKQSQKSQIFVACFKRSMYTNTYVRHFSKIDIVMAESFGLIGLLSMILFCLYKGYNNWVLERENVGEQKQINIFDYYKHQIKTCCLFLANNLKQCLLFFRCYRSVKWIQSKLCFCLFKPKVVEEKKQDEKKKNRLEDELDLYKSRRQLNYLRKKVNILTDLICQKFPELESKLRKQVRLSEPYQLTQSLINESDGSESKSFMDSPFIIS